MTLEGRAGALASMHSFLLHCSDLAAEDTVRRLLLPIEAALLMLSRYTKWHFDKEKVLILINVLDVMVMVQSLINLTLSLLFQYNTNCQAVWPTPQSIYGHGAFATLRSSGTSSSTII